MSDPRNCADCGREVQLRHRGSGDLAWAEWLGPTTEFPRGWRYTCRHEFGRRSDGAPILLSADYHYVAGEEQRHFRKPD